MRKKIGKVKELNPQKYYACCAVKLTAKNKQEIYELFSEYMEAYMTEWHNVREAREAIAAYVFKYNFERCHSSVGNVLPASVYYPVLLYEAARQASMPEQRLNAAGSAA